MRAPRVLTLSYYNDPNFGDRLGYHLINSLVPPNTEMTHAAVFPWSVPDEPFDLLVLGIGNSLNAATVKRPELYELIDRVPFTIGIFGTQYPTQYAKVLGEDGLPNLIDKLTYWFARNQRDVELFGAGRDNVFHMGDWLINAFPMAVSRKPETYVVEADIKETNVCLDRYIQYVQDFQKVQSARLHPLLCAMTSAREVAYSEQFEDPYGTGSGKFDALLTDIFGRSFPPEEFFAVDREAVTAYKTKVAANTVILQEKIAECLESSMAAEARAGAGS